MHAVAGRKGIRAESLYGYAVDLCLANRERDIVRKIFEKDFAAEIRITRKKEAGDDRDDRRDGDELDERKTSLYALF
jgi:hypothetical protein